MHHFELLGFSWSFVKPVGVHESSTSDCFWAFLETTQLVSVGSTSVGLRNFGMLRDSCFWALGTPYVFRGLQSSDVFMLPPGDRESDKALAELLSVTHLQTSHPQFDGCSVCVCVCLCNSAVHATNLAVQVRMFTLHVQGAGVHHRSL